MLRITITDTASEQRWILQGQLAGPWVAELSSNWKETHSRRQGRTCVVDLSDVTFIDQSAEEVLRAMMAAGAQFIACGVCTKHVLENLDRAIRSRHRRAADGDCVEWGKEGHDVGSTEDRDG